MTKSIYFTAEMVAGNTTEYVNSVIHKVEDGNYTGGLNIQATRSYPKELHNWTYRHYCLGWTGCFLVMIKECVFWWMSFTYIVLRLTVKHVNLIYHRHFHILMDAWVLLDGTYSRYGHMTWCITSTVAGNILYNVKHYDWDTYRHLCT